jgi:hypothetical protein
MFTTKCKKFKGEIENYLRIRGKDMGTFFTFKVERHPGFW